MMTCSKKCSDKLIALASRIIPFVLVVLYIRSEPAKSTKCTFPEVNTVCSARTPSLSSAIVNTACERLEVVFIAVLVVRRVECPVKNSSSASSSFSTSKTFKFFSTSPCSPSSSCTVAHSSRGRCARAVSSKSYTVSLYISVKDIWHLNANAGIDVFRCFNSANNSPSERGIRPLSANVSPPKIVYVFPDPVCPYANIVQLNPSNTP
mmetsp:Transcript_23561/g.39254  ORF Transcript_23561/g.39254 Transcript_23561/m.39254 type:complete len:207 (-) Transcript_23561:407-1027(-)